jgi:immunity protein, SdpI family
MKIKKIYIIFPIFLILVSLALAIYFYPIFPAQIVTHWGINGQANGWSSKSFGLFFMPILLSFLLLLFVFLPKTDPYKKNFNQFKKYYQNFISIIFIFLFYIYLITIFWNLNFRFNMTQVISPAFAFIFYYAGVLTSHAKRNWFVGIRTPWTLSNEKVWEKTHQIGSKLFKITAFISLLSLLFPNFAMFFILIPIIATTIFVFIYSYIEYQRIN